ncbi:MAG: GNAT family N-acetyltransferase [Gammaproteobacteria bacterium]|nr:GNAT family N-acetyltransferase [Gammaproteobacteria bacterium]
MDIKNYHGADILPYLDDLARLRITVFRDFPYLYDGDLDYERNYLATYARSPRSLFVLAMDDGNIVGASTGLPLSDAEADFQRPFREAGIDINDVFYFGESVLLPDYRGHGIGHRFFDEREKFAKDQGFSITAFCAVERPADHTARPQDYRPLDEFWQSRGYQRQDDLVTTYRWKDIGDEAESEKNMLFWLRGL